MIKIDYFVYIFLKLLKNHLRIPNQMLKEKLKPNELI